LKRGPFLPLLLASSITLSSTLFYSDFNSILPKAYAGDKDCEDKAFEKYLKKGDEPFEKYLDNADDVPLPSDEDDVDEYLDELEPLAEDYIKDLEPHAEKYIEDLEDCLGY
jgi:hypothetical protein